jgi:hypothetical protein
MTELLEMMICAVYFRELPLSISDISSAPMPIKLSVVLDFAERVFRDCQWGQVMPQMCRFLDQLIERACPSHHRCSDLAAPLRSHAKSQLEEISEHIYL